MSLSKERLQQLEKIEDNVVNVIQCASQSLLELSKEQPSQEYILKTTQEFLQGDIVHYSKVPLHRCSVRRRGWLANVRNMVVLEHLLMVSFESYIDLIHQLLFCSH